MEITDWGLIDQVEHVVCSSYRLHQVVFLLEKHLKLDRQKGQGPLQKKENFSHVQKSFNKYPPKELLRAFRKSCLDSFILPKMNHPSYLELLAMAECQLFLPFNGHTLCSFIFCQKLIGYSFITACYGVQFGISALVRYPAATELKGDLKGALRQNS